MDKPQNYKQCNAFGCNKMFVPYRPYQLFCSTKCRERETGRRYIYQAKPEEDKICDNCEETYKSNKENQRFCSQICCDNWYARQHVKPTERICAYAKCKEKFKSSHVIKKYCSEECRRQAREYRKARRPNKMVDIDTQAAQESYEEEHAVS